MAGASGLLGEDRDVGRASAEHANRRLLRGTVDLGDVVARALDLCGQRARTRVRPDDQRSRRVRRGDGQLTQGVALVHPLRVPAAAGPACVSSQRVRAERCA